MIVDVGCTQRRVSDRSVPPRVGDCVPLLRSSFALGSVLLATACGGETHSLGAGRIPDAAVVMPVDASTPLAEADASAATESGAGGSFEPPRPIEALAGEAPSDDDPSLTQDLREIYFNSKRDEGKGREDVWFATRATADAAWSAPRPAAELNTGDRETGVALSADGLTIWFSSDRPDGEGGLDVYTAVRSSRSEPFRNVSRVAGLSSSRDDLVSAVDLTSQALYLARRDDEDDDYDLFVARRMAATAPWADAAPISSLNSDAEESDAYAVGGGARLLFTRDGDLVLAQRQSSGEYAITRKLDELNSDDDERDAWASEDLSHLVFSSDRSGSYLLYETRIRD